MDVRYHLTTHVAQSSQFAHGLELATQVDVMSMILCKVRRDTGGYPCKDKLHITYLAGLNTIGHYIRQQVVGSNHQDTETLLLLFIA